MSNGTTDEWGAVDVVLRCGVAVALLLAALALYVVIGLPAGAVLSVTLDDPGEGLITVLDSLILQGAFATVALAFLGAVVGWQYVNVRAPTARDLQVAGGALAIPLGLETVRLLAIRFGWLAEATTVPLGDDPGVAVLAMLAVLALLVAPAVEELFFRGVVQRYVRQGTSLAVGVTVATVLFVGIHVPGIALSAASVPGGLAVGAVLVVLSVAIGIAYARTDTLLVPIGVHVVYNLLVIGLSTALV